jgi:hypothetical protein
MSDATRILQAVEQGDPSAAEKLLPLVYDEIDSVSALAHVLSTRGASCGFCVQIFTLKVDGPIQRTTNHSWRSAEKTRNGDDAGLVCFREVTTQTIGEM